MEGDFFVFLKDIVTYVGYLLPVVVPILIISRLKRNYQIYMDDKSQAGLEHVVLEIRPPEEVYKSPAAFELLLGSLYDTGREQTWVKTELQGKSRPEFSLEIASFGGNVVFYIRCEVGLKHRVESQLYAQYPGIEVKEVEDYMKDMEFDPDKQDLWFCEWKLAAPDVYPIVTYIDFGLDKETDDDYRIDPLTPVIEFMGSIEQNFFAGYQIIIRSHKKKTVMPPFKSEDKWVEDAKKEIAKIRKEAVTEVDLGDRKEVLSNPTKGQQEKIASLERSIGKHAFDAGIRIMYMAPKDSFHKGHVGSFLGAYRHYSSPALNGIKPGVTPGFDYPWYDISGKYEQYQKEEAFKAYKARSYFHQSRLTYRLFGPGGRTMRKEMVFTTEELASLYHFPGRVAQTPITRADSRRSTPPTNLPT